MIPKNHLLWFPGFLEGNPYIHSQTLGHLCYYVLIYPTVFCCVLFDFV